MSDKMFTIWQSINEIPGLAYKNKSKKEAELVGEMILKGIDAIDNDQPEEAAFVMHRIARENGIDVSANPIIELLAGRACHEAHIRGVGNEMQKVWFEENRLGSFMEAALLFDYAHEACLTWLAETENEVAKKMLGNVRLMYQYSLYHLLRLGADLGRDVGEFPADWDDNKFGELNEYENIDPFVLRLCPPHHIWKKYVCNGFVYELKEDGTLFETSVDEYDFSKEKRVTLDNPYDVKE